MLESLLPILKLASVKTVIISMELNKQTQQSTGPSLKSHTQCSFPEQKREPDVSLLNGGHSSNLLTLSCVQGSQPWRHHSYLRNKDNILFLKLGWPVSREQTKTTLAELMGFTTHALQSFNKRRGRYAFILPTPLQE